MVVRCNLGVFEGWDERGGSWDSKITGLDRIGAIGVEFSRVVVDMWEVVRGVHTAGMCTLAGECLRLAKNVRLATGA